MRGCSGMPKALVWALLDNKDGDDLEIQYPHTLESLDKQGDMLGAISSAPGRNIYLSAILRPVFTMEYYHR